ncbi:MAG: prepilin-type N-terminal cleavage/methylation domain-containing protein [Candidatus Aminicenantes bacterium]|nr:prepilin-type N-terminal cleavage/methylation domain-containing protein [Candidatus Aminicenantes bacterium]
MRKAFSLIELLVGSAIMLIVLAATLSIYTRSNRSAVDQKQFSDLQNNVRAGIYFLAKDVRSAGAGFLPEIAGYFMEGTDAASDGDAAADSIRLMGNYDDPLLLRVEDYSGGAGGGAATAFLYDFSLENSPYACPEFYEQRNVLLISVRCPGCYAYRYIDNNMVFGCGEGANHVNFTPGSSDLNPPGGLVDTVCADECWIDAIITLGQIKLYWLDATGNLTSFKEFALTPGQDGYIGQPGVLYVSTTFQQGGITHLPIARNIENLQFQYNGDMDNDNFLDGFQDWDNVNWTISPTDTASDREAKLGIISRIRQVRMWVQGKTERPYVSVSGTPPAGVYIYQRPSLANSPGDSTVDRHRRFVLESTSNVRNLSLSLYNIGTR